MLSCLSFSPLLPMDISTDTACDAPFAKHLSLNLLALNGTVLFSESQTETGLANSVTYMA